MAYSELPADYDLQQKLDQTYYQLRILTSHIANFNFSYRGKSDLLWKSPTQLYNSCQSYLVRSTNNLFKSIYLPLAGAYPVMRAMPAACAETFSIYVPEDVAALGASIGLPPSAEFSSPQALTFHIVITQEGISQSSLSSVPSSLFPSPPSYSRSSPSQFELSLQSVPSIAPPPPEYEVSPYLPGCRHLTPASTESSPSELQPYLFYPTQEHVPLFSYSSQ